MGRAERKPQRHFQRYNQGVTLVEMMIVVVILGIVASIAVPSFNSYFERERVKRAAEDIYGLVLQAKAEGPIRDADMSVSVDTDAWCVGFSATPNCVCADNACRIDVANATGDDGVVQVVSGTDHPDVTIAGIAGTTFEQPRGSANTPGNITVTSGGSSLQIQITTEGRVRLCNPNGDSQGYDEC
ncbi:MAG: hypothetical protein VR73_00095 [Gammaproteobacteria bacterium BRH_c0]|nr:MAG: hypothetical protein VR73_00095 [Gammaproteobacteria bacterium BRH_c0]